MDPTFPLKECVESGDRTMFENVGTKKNHNVKVTYTDIVHRNGTVSETPQKSTVKFVLGTKIELVGTTYTMSLGKR